MQLDITLLVKVLTIFGGIAILLIGIFYSKKDKGKLKIKRCTSIADGHIVGFDDREKLIRQKKYTEYRSYNTYHRKKTVTYYTPYIKFEDQAGNVVEEKYPYPLERRLSNGQKVKIKYNPENPFDFYISGDKKIQTFSTQAIAAGALMIIIGFAMLFYK